MRMELREYVVSQNKTSSFFWVRYGGNSNFTICDRKGFFELCRWDDGGRGKMIRSPHNITLLLDSLEAKTREDHEITIEAINGIINETPELKILAISVLTLGPTQRVFKDNAWNSNILSGSLFKEKHRFLRKYKNRLRGYKVAQPFR